MDSLLSLDGFTAANFKCPPRSSQPTTAEHLARATAAGDEDSEEDAFHSPHTHAAFLTGHLGLGDDYLAPTLAELCPNTPQKPKRSYNGTQYKGRGRPRKTDIVENDASRPKRARRTRILIEKEFTDNSAAQIPNILRATKLRGIGSPDEIEGNPRDPSASCGLKEPGKATQPHFFYGSSPPGISNNSIFLRYAYPYGLGLDDNVLSEQPAFDPPRETFDDDSLFEEFIDTEGGNVIVQETPDLLASSQVPPLHLVAAGANGGYSVENKNNIHFDHSDKDLFKSVEDSLFDDLYEEEHSSNLYRPPNNSSSSPSEIFQTEPHEDPLLYSIEEDYSTAGVDDWNCLDDAALLAIVPSLDFSIKDLSANQPLKKTENNVNATAKEQVTPQAAMGQRPNSTSSSYPIIVRSPFPEPVRDRSPLLGLSSETQLRTCFRLGEALNTGCHAARCGGNIVLEMYARVIASHRHEDKAVSSPSTTSRQYFTFADLFHDHGPFVTGVYEGWKGVTLFEADSAAFLGLADGDSGMICRVLGKMQRGSTGKEQGTGKSWELSILSIWEASWEDVKWAEGIVST